MVVLADNDVLLKLAACSLIDRFPGLLSVEPPQVWVLEQCPYVARDRKDRYGEEAINRLLQFIEDASILDSSQTDETCLERLLTLEKVNAGEAILFATAVNLDHACVATGDKGSLRCLASAPECDDVCARLNGSIFCFEQIMHRFLHDMEYAKYRGRVAPARECDGVLEYMAFSRGMETPRRQAEGAFQSNIQSLRGETGDLLVVD